MYYENFYQVDPVDQKTTNLMTSINSRVNFSGINEVTNRKQIKDNVIKLIQRINETGKIEPIVISEELEKEINNSIENGDGNQFDQSIKKVLVKVLEPSISLEDSEKIDEHIPKLLDFFNSSKTNDFLGEEDQRDLAGEIDKILLIANLASGQQSIFTEKFFNEIQTSLQNENVDCNQDEDNSLCVLTRSVRETDPDKLRKDGGKPGGAGGGAGGGGGGGAGGGGGGGGAGGGGAAGGGGGGNNKGGGGGGNNKGGGGNDNNSNNNNKRKFSDGEIVGIVVGSIAAVVLLGVGIYKLTSRPQKPKIQVQGRKSVSRKSQRRRSSRK